MFNLSEVTKHLEEPKTPAKLKKFNEVFSLQLQRLAPSSIVTGRVLHERNRYKEKAPAKTLERTKGELPKEVNELTKTALSLVSRVKVERSQVSTSNLKPQRKPEEGKLHNLSSTLAAPKKRNMTEFIQNSMKYGDHLSKFVDTSSISPTKQQKPASPDEEEFNLTQAFQQAKLSESKSVYMQVRELHKKQKLRRTPSALPESQSEGHLTQTSGRLSQRKNYERVVKPTATKTRKLSVRRSSEFK